MIRVTPGDRAIGARIRARRTELGLSLQQLAAAVGGMSWQQLQKCETGAERVSPAALPALALVLNLSLAGLLCAPYGRERRPSDVDASIMAIAKTCRRLAEKDRRAVLALVHVLAGPAPTAVQRSAP